MDNATRVLLLHHAEGAGTFGVCKRATRDAADELAQANQTLRQCGKGTRARYAAYAARCGAEACRLWSEEPGCAKSLARLGGEIKEMREDPGGHHHRWDDDNDKAVSSDDDYSDPAEPLTMASAERRALAEDLQERIGAGCCHAANAVRVAVVRTGRRAAEAARDRVRHDLHVAAAQCVSRLGSTVSKAPAEEQCAAADAVEALLFPTSKSGTHRSSRTGRKFSIFEAQQLPDDDAFALASGPAAARLARALVPTIFAPLLDVGPAGAAANASVGATAAWSDGDALVQSATHATATDLGGVSVGAGVCTKAVINHIAQRVVGAVSDAAVERLVVETARGSAVAPGPEAIVARLRHRLEKDFAAHAVEIAAATRRMFYAAYGDDGIGRNTNTLSKEHVEEVMTEAVARLCGALERDATYVARRAADAAGDWVFKLFADATGRVAGAAGNKLKVRVGPILTNATYPDGFRVSSVKSARKNLTRIAQDFEQIDVAARSLRRVARVLDGRPPTPDPEQEPLLAPEPAANWRSIQNQNSRAAAAAAAAAAATCAAVGGSLRKERTREVRETAARTHALLRTAERLLEQSMSHQQRHVSSPWMDENGRDNSGDDDSTGSASRSVRVFQTAPNGKKRVSDGSGRSSDDATTTDRNDDLQRLFTPTPKPSSNRVDPLSKLALAAEMETELDAKEDSFGAREESGDVVGTESEEEDVVGTEDDDDNVAPLADATRPGPEIVAEKPVAAPEPVVPPSAVLQAHTRTVFVPAVPATRPVPQHPQSNARGSGALSSDKAPAAAPSIDCSAEKQPRLAQKTASRDCVAGPSRVVGATEAPGAGAGAVAGPDTSCVDAPHAMPGQMAILERPTTGDVPTLTPTIDGVAETAPAVSANLNLQKPTQVPPAGPGTSASSEYRRGVAEGFVAGVLTQTWRALDTSFSQAIADAFTESLPSCPAGVMAMLLPLSKALTLCGRNAPREADVPGTQPENSKEALRDSHDTAPSARGTAEPWKEPTDGTPGKTKPVPSPAAMPVWAARAVAAKRRGKNPKNNSPPLALRFVPPPERKGGARAGEFSTDRETPETKATGKQSEKKHRKNQTEAPINTTDQGGKPKPPVTLRAFGVSLDLRPKAPAQSAPFLTPATDQPVTEKRKRVSSGFLSRDDGTSVAPTSSFDGGGGVGVGVGVVSITNPRPVLKKNKNTGPAGDAGDVIVFDDSDFESDEFDSEFESSGDEKEVLPVPKKQRAVSHLGGKGAQNPQIPHSAPLIKPPRNPVVAKRVQLVPVAVRGQAPAGIVEKKKHPETTTQGAVVADVICPRLCPLP